MFIVNRGTEHAENGSSKKYQQMVLLLKVPFEKSAAFDTHCLANTEHYIYLCCLFAFRPLDGNTDTKLPFKKMLGAYCPACSGKKRHKK
jgi:hypothetical protein